MRPVRRWQRPRQHGRQQQPLQEADRIGLRGARRRRRLATRWREVEQCGEGEREREVGAGEWCGDGVRDEQFVGARRARAT